MNRFTITRLPLPGLAIIARQRLEDARGFLTRIFCADELREAGWNGPIAQINHTRTACRGTIRGMHFQLPPHSEKKLVSCLSGEIWDVAVDIRADSPSFLHWYGVRLSGENGLALLIPEGFAHGFQTLSNNADLLYCHSAAYAPGAEGGLNPQDPRLAIDWPLPPTALSDRDLAHPFIDATFTGVRL
jgi:dTDP-4-dehydrorhamnose 3,5-epimerase